MQSGQGSLLDVGERGRNRAFNLLMETKEQERQEQERRRRFPAAQCVRMSTVGETGGRETPPPLVSFVPYFRPNWNTMVEPSVKVMVY